MTDGDLWANPYHCDSGILQNRAMIDKSDVVDQITIGIIYNTGPGPCDPEEEVCHKACLATIFNDAECSGASKLIRSDILYRPDIRMAPAKPPT